MFLRDLNETQQKLFLGIARDLIEADNNISSQEKAMIAALSVEMGQQELIRNPADDTIRDFFPDKISRTAVMLELIGLSACDGDYSVEEDKIIRKIQKIFAMSDEQIKAYRDWVKKLYTTYGEAAVFFK